MTTYHPALAPCQRCGADIEVRLEDKGRTVTCPACAAVYAVDVREIGNVELSKQRGWHLRPELTLLTKGSR